MSINRYIYISLYCHRASSSPAKRLACQVAKPLYSMLEERLEQVREIDGELAYEKMRRAVEKASQEKARQVERARLEWDRQETARQSRERRGPERGGAGAGLWPQPLVWSCSGGVREWNERIGRKHER